MAISEMRDDLYLGILTKFGQIKRMALSSLELVKRNRPAKYMKLLTNDSIADIKLLTGDSDLLVITNNGNCSLFNENELTILGNKAGGVKSISSLGSNQAVGLLEFERDERNKIILITNKGHMRITDTSKFFRTNRLGKVQTILQSFKGDPHSIIYAMIGDKREEKLNLDLYLNDRTIFNLEINDFRNTEAQYAKKNIDGITLKQHISFVFDTSLIVVNKDNVSHPIIVKETPKAEAEEPVEAEEENEEPEKENSGFEQISIFDDLD